MILKWDEPLKIVEQSISSVFDYVDGVFGFSTMKEYSGDYASLFKITIPKKELDSINPLKQIFQIQVDGRS